MPGSSPLYSSSSSRGYVSLICAIAAFIATYVYLTERMTKTQTEVNQWLKETGLSSHKKILLKAGCRSLVGCAAIDAEVPGVPGWTAARARLRDVLVLRLWLQQHGLDPAPLNKHQPAIQSLSELRSRAAAGQQFPLSWGPALAELATVDVASLTDLLWTLLVQWQRGDPLGWGMILLVSVAVAFIVAMAVQSQSRAQSLLLEHSASVAKLGFFSYVTGKYLAPQNCRVDFEWSGPQPVGRTVAFTVRFFQRNGNAYPISDEDNLLVEVVASGGNAQKVACSLQLGGTDPAEANRARVQFAVHQAGDYNISVLLGMVHIRGSPFVRSFIPGNPDPQKTGFVQHCSTVVATEGVPHYLCIEPRDKYNNLCTLRSDWDPSEDYTLDILEVGSERPIPLRFRWEVTVQPPRIALVLNLESEGCYRALVSYRGFNLKNGDFHIIVLSKDKTSLVNKNVAKKNHNIWYEAKLLSLNGERLAKPKKVFCYISPKQLLIKEFMLKIFPKRVTTFRLCPSTKFHFQPSPEAAALNQGEEVMTIDDGCQPPVEISSPERNVIAATFTQFLLRNIGGSETFKDKQDFFYHEVRKLHSKYFHDKLPIRVSRDKLLESSMKATKGFSTSEWCKSFEITFLQEQGLDWGGLRREWFELICQALFHPDNLLFHSFKQDKQGLVHPNPHRPPHLKLKHYEFAGRIVGKCLYESSLGPAYRQLVKARFSRSFLAQLIGLRVHYKYFEQDDPELYISKIKYILENDMEDLELYFVEEEYSGPNNQVVKTVELIPGGARTRVTNQNKLQYLDALAQYRLAASVKDEVDSFLKGLNDLIPDNLLCIFDENELELLMCGTGQYSIADFKAHHAVSGSNYEFRKVLDWFWTAVSSFTEEEMGRLLQFTTGCSQLPPGGFGELNPRFHITSPPTFGTLPTAHTCFNQLCLPDYENYEQFERALRLAITEGSEGFGMI